MLSIGLDIGGANTKLAVCLWDETVPGKHEMIVDHAESRYFPFWQERDAFPGFLGDLLAPLGGDVFTVTTTAELADCFQTKREGVRFILSAFSECENRTKVLLNSGRLVSLEEGLSRPQMVGAANWLAPAMLLAGHLEDALLVDVGSTTTDIIPISGGAPAVDDPSDRGRLTNHQLVYTGSQRTNVATIVDYVEVSGKRVGVASENFATTADVNLVLGLITEEEVICPPSDGGEVSKKGAMRRLSRVICSDLESLSPEEVVEIAAFIHSTQVEKVARSISIVFEGNDFGHDTPCILAGSGETVLGRPACLAAGIRNTLRFPSFLEENISVILRPPPKLVSISAPAVSVALLALLEEAPCG